MINTMKNKLIKNESMLLYIFIILIVLIVMFKDEVMIFASFFML